MTYIIDDVDNLLSNDTVHNIQQGKEAFENIRTELNNTIAKNIPTVTDALSEAGKLWDTHAVIPEIKVTILLLKGIGIRKASSEVNLILDRISDAVGNNSYQYFDKADQYIQDYYKYVYYSGIALSSVLLLVLLCVVLGLLCGICGKRPDGYGDDCCNKGAGSRFLMM